MNTVSCNAPNIFYFNNDSLTEILLYGKEDLDNINNTSILDATSNYLVETKRSDAIFFMLSVCNGFNIDIAFKIHIFFLFLFCFYCFYLFITFRLFFYILYVYFFDSRYITTCICIPGGCKFFRLMCRCYIEKRLYKKLLISTWKSNCLVA